MAKQNLFANVPTELLELIGVFLAHQVKYMRVIASAWLWDYHGEAAAEEAHTYYRLILVDKRFSSIFSPRLYKQLVLRYQRGKTSFVKQTALNRELCPRITTLLYADSYFGNVRLKHILAKIPFLTTLRLTKWNGDSLNVPFSVRLPRLRTLEVFDENWMITLSQSFKSVLPQIEKLVVPTIDFTRKEHIKATTFHSFLTGLKVLHIRTSSHMETTLLTDEIVTDKLEEFDITMPYSIVSQWFKIGQLDRWRDTLRVFRFKCTTKDVFGKLAEETELEYLEEVLRGCQVVEIDLPIQRNWCKDFDIDAWNSKSKYLKFK